MVTTSLVAAPKAPTTPTAIAPRPDAPAPELVTGRRPADVLAARAAYVPEWTSLSWAPLADAGRAQELVHAAIDVLPTPRIYVNRQLEGAEAQLKSRAAFPTMFDIPEDRRPSDYDQRKQVEEQFGTFGRDADAGRSVYGSVQFGDRVHRTPDGGITSAKTGAGLLNTGIQMYGQVSLILKPDVWARTTVHPGDSYSLPKEVRPGSVENLSDVATQLLARDSQTLNDIIGQPTSKGAASVQRFLTSTALQQNHSMLEAVVRTAGTSDIAEVHILRHPETQPRSDAERAIDRIRYAARKLGIPVHQRTATWNDSPYTNDRAALQTSAPKPRATLPKGYASPADLAVVNTPG